VLLLHFFAHTVGKSSAYEQIHDYVASELDRLIRAEAGALVVNGVATILIATKARLLRPDGILPLADLISNRMHQYRGLAK